MRNYDYREINQLYRPVDLDLYWNWNQIRTTKLGHMPISSINKFIFPTLGIILPAHAKICPKKK